MQMCVQLAQTHVRAFQLLCMVHGYLFGFHVYNTHLSEEYRKRMKYFKQTHYANVNVFTFCSRISSVASILPSRFHWAINMINVFFFTVPHPAVAYTRIENIQMQMSYIIWHGFGTTKLLVTSFAIEWMSRNQYWDMFQYIRVF